MRRWWLARLLAGLVVICSISLAHKIKYAKRCKIHVCAAHTAHQWTVRQCWQQCTVTCLTMPRTLRFLNSDLLFVIFIKMCSLHHQHMFDSHINNCVILVSPYIVTSHVLILFMWSSVISISVQLCQLQCNYDNCGLAIIIYRLSFFCECLQILFTRSCFSHPSFLGHMLSVYFSSGRDVYFPAYISRLIYIITKSTFVFFFDSFTCSS